MGETAQNTKPKRNGNGTNKTRQMVESGVGIGLSIALGERVFKSTGLSEPVVTGIAFFTGMFVAALGLNAWWRCWFSAPPFSMTTVLKWLGQCLLIGIALALLTVVLEKF